MPAVAARWWKPLNNNRVICNLCPRLCKIGDGQTGFCYIRKNEGGKLVTLGYGQPAAIQVDPIEKKPLNHFLPGTEIFSMGGAGCNMGCFFCQNWDISKAKSDQVNAISLSPEAVVENAVRSGCPSIAFTYNEPSIWAEYVIDISRVAHECGLKTVMVTNGYITPEAFYDVYPWIDAANVDLKAFTENFYERLTLTHLAPVLDVLKRLKHDTAVWLEITNLLIPTHNDSEDETKRLTEWILENLGDNVPLHFTAFHPDFKLRDIPRTPHEVLHRAREMAMKEGLKYVYEGNVFCDESQATYCPNCRRAVIRRTWHNLKSYHVTPEGKCDYCQTRIAGHFNLPTKPQKATYHFAIQ
jgi:pyruvate formate lyase activating enzyme